MHRLWDMLTRRQCTARAPFLMAMFARRRPRNIGRCAKTARPTVDLAALAGRMRSRTCLTLSTSGGVDTRKNFQCSKGGTSPLFCSSRPHPQALERTRGFPLPTRAPPRAHCGTHADQKESPLTSPHYHVGKRGKFWTVGRIDQVAHVGTVNTRKQALQIARLLAGWRGTVTTGKRALGTLSPSWAPFPLGAFLCALRRPHASRVRHRGPLWVCLPGRCACLSRGCQPGCTVHPCGNHADQPGVALCFVSLSSLPRNWSRFPSSSVPLPALRCEAPRAGTDQGAAGLVQRALSSLVVSSGALRGVCSSPSPLLRCPVPIGNPRESGLARFAPPSPSAAGLCTPPPRLRARDSCGVAPGAVHRGEFG
jgi:hypothetical protein